LSSAAALALVGENLAHPAHEFWADSVQVPAAVKGMRARLQGYRQLTDACLLVLAQRRQGVLAMFERGLRTLAGDAFLGSLEIVPTRILAAMLHRRSRYSTHGR
jgi:predicted nucleic acid-binding protein